MHILLTAGSSNDERLAIARSPSDATLYNAHPATYMHALVYRQSNLVVSGLHSFPDHRATKRDTRSRRAYQKASFKSSNEVYG